MVDLSRKKTQALLPTDILFQTPYWAQVKTRLGMESHAFDIRSSGPGGDVLVLLRRFGRHRVAIVPQGPEVAPPHEDYGVYLESVSLALADGLGPDVAFIRYDLPWVSPYADEMHDEGWNAFPEARLRELRMNMGTQHWNLRKSFQDLTVASSLVVDISGEEAAVLERMKPKTRYNIGLARRKGVAVREVGRESLPQFHALYRQTAMRNGFEPCSIAHFSAMFHALCDGAGSTELLFLLATHGTDILAGCIVGLAGRTANFLYGASGNVKRNLMAPYLMHWTAMCHARDRGCHDYEMGAVPPGHDPAHPFHGLYRFKTGFGGRVTLRSGSWDYPLDHAAYRDFCNAESLYRTDAAPGRTQ